MQSIAQPISDTNKTICKTFGLKEIYLLNTNQTEGEMAYCNCLKLI